MEKSMSIEEQLEELIKNVDILDELPTIHDEECEEIFIDKDIEKTFEIIIK